MGQLEPWRQDRPPLLMYPGVVIRGVVDDRHHPTRTPRAVAVELVEELSAGDLVEHPLLPPIDQLPIAQSDRAPVAYRLVRVGVEQHRVPHLGRDPHLAAGPVLLEVDLVHRPEVDREVLAQCLEFFLCAAWTTGSPAAR